MRDEVRFGDDGGLNSRGGELLLEVRVEGEINGGAKLNFLPGCLLINTFQGLRRAAILDDKLHRIFCNDLFVFQQLEESIVRDILKLLVGAAAKEYGEADQGKGDRDEDNAAPIEIGLVPTRFVLLLRIAVWLRHR